MKKLSVFAGALVGALALLSFSCESLNGLVQTPSAEIKSVTISGLDLEGISFNCNYAIKNPYGVSLSVKDVEMDVDCSNSKVTSLKSQNGLTINAQTTSSNVMNFKLPYDSILELAKNYSEAKKTLPFNLDGSITIDTSSVPALSAIGTNSITVPLKTDFDVPVFKPTLSVSNFKVKMPSLSDLKDSLTKGGVGLTTAIKLATTLLSGEKLSANIFDGIALDIDFTFDLNVANEGGADWNFKINDCSFTTSSGSIADVGPEKNSTISSKNSTVPMKATLNTIQAGAFIVQLLNKSGTNPTFNLSSGLTFPDTSYAKNIPLNYSVEVPLSSIKR